jgi:hypothetical protein
VENQSGEASIMESITEKTAKIYACIFICTLNIMSENTKTLFVEIGSLCGLQIYVNRSAEMRTMEKDERYSDAS